MKTVAKRLIERTARYTGLAWFMYRVYAVECHTISRQIHGHARWVTGERRTATKPLTRIAGDLFPNLDGRYRPLQRDALSAAAVLPGARYCPSFWARTSRNCMPRWRSYLPTNTTAVVDVGCAEGYYAVGLGPKTKECSHLCLRHESASQIGLC